MIHRSHETAKQSDFIILAIDLYGFLSATHLSEPQITGIQLKVQRIPILCERLRHISKRDYNYIKASEHAISHYKYETIL